MSFEVTYITNLMQTMVFTKVLKMLNGSALSIASFWFSIGFVSFGRGCVYLRLDISRTAETPL